MAASRVSIIALILLLSAWRVRGMKNVTVDAAVTYFGTNLVLIADGELNYIYANRQMSASPQTNFGIPREFRATAASMSPDNKHIHFFGPEFYYDFTVGGAGDVKKVDYPRRARFHFWGNEGPDAAVWINGKEFFFKGCLMVKNRQWARHTNITTFNLPCTPDAAWSIEDRTQTVFLKGDQIWIWDGKKEADGPKDFSSVYTLKTWELVPSSSNE